MGEPRKKRKQYETPRKQWDKRLLTAERKLLDTYGLTKKREIRRWMTWLKYKRKQAKGLLALPLDKRQQRQAELMSGLAKIGLVGRDSTLDDVLGMKIEELMEKRLQTMVMRKGLANTANQARQFITHGHIAINGKRVSSPGYIVHVDEAEAIGWYRKPIKLLTAEPKKDLKKEFEEAAGVTAAEGQAAAPEKTVGESRAEAPAETAAEGGAEAGQTNDKEGAT